MRVFTEQQKNGEWKFYYLRSNGTRNYPIWTYTSKAKAYKAGGVSNG